MKIYRGHSHTIEAKSFAAGLCLEAWRMWLQLEDLQCTDDDIHVNKLNINKIAAAAAILIKQNLNYLQKCTYLHITTTH